MEKETLEQKLQAAFLDGARMAWRHASNWGINGAVSFEGLWQTSDTKMSLQKCPPCMQPDAFSPADIDELRKMQQEQGEHVGRPTRPPRSIPLINPEQVAGRLTREGKIAQATTEAVNHYEENQRLLKEAPPGVAAGDIYLIANTPSNPSVFIAWVVLGQHPDDKSLWSVVPYDDHFLVGNYDIQTNEVGVLRCGYSWWASETMLNHRIGFVKQEVVQEARTIIANLARGKTALVDREEVECDPTYREWCDELAKAVEELTQLTEGTENG